MSFQDNTFTEWTQGRRVQWIGTNASSPSLPFQHWQNFKEAFAPELVERAVRESRVSVKTCLDPFGGSGTTSLACQFLGVRPTTVEINPYLADVIDAKLTSYSSDILAKDLGRLLKVRHRKAHEKGRFAVLPKTFIEPGHNGRWIFDKEVADEIGNLLDGIDSLIDPKNQRFFRVILGGTLVSMSNARISGKGRRYRSNWKVRRITRTDARLLFTEAVQHAILELHRFSRRPIRSFEVIRGDSRLALNAMLSKDLVVFSPPYPNSFDYTDVYNIELWMLGYLKEASHNSTLRRSTLTSHVQIRRDFAPPPGGSPILASAMKRLKQVSGDLWSPHIPPMIGAYFSEIDSILSQIHTVLAPGGAAWMVVGDSQYGGIRVPTADILRELSEKQGFSLRGVEPFRSMRSSPQQGGKAELPETLLILEKPQTRSARAALNASSVE